MSKQLRVAFGVTIFVASAVTAVMAGSPATMMTFNDVDGSRYFALSVQPTDPVPSAEVGVTRIKFIERRMDCGH